MRTSAISRTTRLSVIAGALNSPDRQARRALLHPFQVLGQEAGRRAHSLGRTVALGRALALERTVALGRTVSDRVRAARGAATGRMRRAGHALVGFARAVLARRVRVRPLVTRSAQGELRSASRQTVRAGGFLIRSLSAKLVLLSLIFAAVPFIVYQQFRDGFAENQRLLLQSVQDQGRLVARAIQPMLAGRAGEADVLLFERLGEELERLAGDGVAVRLLLHPEAATAVDEFYYVASSFPLSEGYLEQERAELLQQRVFEKFVPSCQGGIESAIRFEPTEGAEEIITSITPVLAPAGCWLVIASHSTGPYRDSTLGKPYWERAEVQSAAFIYLAMVMAILALFGGVWRSLRRFGRLAGAIRASRGEVPTFAKQNRIPELAVVAEEFDDMVETLQNSARSIKRAAEDNAHALKTPIAIIRQCLEPLTANTGGNSGRGARALEMIGSALDRLDVLVSFARRMDETEAELIAPPQDAVKPGLILRRLAMEYEELVRNKNVTVEIDADDEISIRASDDLIETVFENLLENALSFSPPSGTIRMSVRRAGVNAELTVEDDGVGVAHENLEKIFTRYYSDRPDSSGIPSGNHMGIGLWTVRRKIEAIGGAVTAENRDGGGLRVVAIVPAPA